MAAKRFSSFSVEVEIEMLEEALGFSIIKKKKKKNKYF
jgi:hypothetical protein